MTGVPNIAAVLSKTFGLNATQAAALMAQATDLGPLAVLNQLSDAGLNDRDISAAMTAVYRWGAALVDAADLAVTDAARHLGDLFGIERGKVKLVLFNHTEHLLVVTGVRGDEIQRGPDHVVLPGDAGVVAVFDDAGGRWEWVYLQDQTTGEEYQLYIERTRSGPGTQYTASATATTARTRLTATPARSPGASPHTPGTATAPPPPTH
jgi:hypothetical protein